MRLNHFENIFETKCHNQCGICCLSIKKINLRSCESIGYIILYILSQMTSLMKYRSFRFGIRIVTPLTNKREVIMDFKIDYGDIGKSVGVQKFLIKKSRKIDRFSDQAKSLTVDIRKESSDQKRATTEFAIDLEWVPKDGRAIYVTGRDRSFHKATADSFNCLIRKINKAKTSYTRESIRDYKPMSEFALNQNLENIISYLNSNEI